MKTSTDGVAMTVADSQTCYKEIKKTILRYLTILAPLLWQFSQDSLFQTTPFIVEGEESEGLKEKIRRMAKVIVR